MKQAKQLKIKEKKETSIQDEIRGLGVMIEHVDNNVSLVTEQYGDIKEILNTHTEILNYHSQVLDTHTKTLESHSRTLQSHTEMLGKTMIDIEITKQDIEFIKNSFKKKIDLDEFVALERRVTLLEKHR